MNKLQMATTGWLWLNPNSKMGPIVAQLLWPLPARSHDWMARVLGGRPGRIVFNWTFDAQGRRHINRCQYLWEPTLLLRGE